MSAVRRWPVPSPLGVGTYRMRAENPVHQDALRAAFALGCRIVDTASNYGDGSSETLVGEVLAATGARDICVWTKAGYISPSLGRRLGPGSLTGVARRISDEAHYSLNPEVLESSLELSLERMGLDRVTALFIHNPERAIDASGSEPVYEQLGYAFERCEQLVRRGLIDVYGISSNALTPDGDASPVDRNEARQVPREASSLSLTRLLDLASSVTPTHSLALIQLPVNLLEPDAVSGPGPTLLSLAHDSGLGLAAQRPMNASIDGRRVTLVEGPTRSDAGAALERGRLALERIGASVSTRLAQIERPERAFSFPIMRFLRDAWSDIPDPDILDDVYGRRLSPFLRAVFSDVPAEVEVDARELYRAAMILVRSRFSAGSVVRTQLVADGYLKADDSRSLQTVAVEYPLTMGADAVLVGMRRPEYVAELGALLQQATAP